jgi:hypothetical protein
MSYYAAPTNSDDRRAKRFTPIRLQNVMLVPMAEGAKSGAGYALVPRPGLSLRGRPMPGQRIRGIFAQEKFLGGKLFVLAGPTLYSIDQSFTASAIGPIEGEGPAQFASLLGALVIVAEGYVYNYDGVALTRATGASVPYPAETLSVLGSRAVTSVRDSDIVAWSATVDALTWPALAFASAEGRSDNVAALIAVGMQMLALGGETAQLFHAVGGADQEAIQIDPTFQRQIGCAARDTLCLVDETPIFVGHDRVPYMMRNFAPTRIVNRALTERLAALDLDGVAALRAFSFAWREKNFWLLRLPNGPAFAYDAETGRAADWASFGADSFALGFAARFNGETIVAGAMSDALHALDDAAADDAGTPRECVMAVHVPVRGPTPIDSITLDLRCHDQPPERACRARVRYYFDGGNIDSVTAWNDERWIDLPPPGDYGVPPPETRFGLAGAGGFLIEVTITDPVGFAFAGIWVNELP